MSKSGLQEFDLKKLADNGLRRGRTTGTCATAAVKAALLLMEKNELHNEVQVRLPSPNDEYYLSVEIDSVQRQEDGSIRASVVKYAGDDPDNTDGAIIFAVARRNNSGTIKFIAGSGVGTVTEPGIRVGVGEPAINPAPRQMMQQAVSDVLDGSPNPGYDLMIGCENGEQIARRTFNPRLGITGGISILGTTGIVEPMSLAAYKASIEVYIRVALADNAESAAFLPGNIGITYAKQKLQLSQKRIVTIANFIGFSVECAEVILNEENRFLDGLWILGHPGKLAKLLDDATDTHSSKSSMAMETVSKVADEIGCDKNIVRSIQESKTVEAVVELLSHDSCGLDVWKLIEDRASAIVQKKTNRVKNVFVRLFSMNGRPLGWAA